MARFDGRRIQNFSLVRTGRRPRACFEKISGRRDLVRHRIQVRLSIQVGSFQPVENTNGIAITRDFRSTQKFT
jgi:hypothetical protein